MKQSDRNDPTRRNASKLFFGTEPFVDDLPAQGDWYGGTVRSKIAHGRLTGLKFDPEFDWSQVVVVTAADIPGKNVVVCHEEDQPSLCDGTIRHYGEPLALIAAPNGDLLHKALRAVEVVVEPLPAVFDPFESLKGKTLIYGKNNLFLEIPIRKGNAAEKFAKCDVVVETNHFTPAQEHAYLETQGIRATPAGHGVRIEGSMQCPYYLVAGVARLLGLHEADVRVIAMQTGGGFGGKEDFPTMLAGHAALLARKCGRPVRMIYARGEDMAATTKRHPAWLRRKTGLNRAGQFVAMEVDLILDGGAYATLSPFVLSRAALHAVGPYRCDHVSIRARAVATNHPPNGGFRGFGCPQVHFATETHIEACAKRLGIDPIELRRMNLVEPGDSMPFGQVLGADTEPMILLIETLRRSDFENRRDALSKWNREKERGESNRRGIGLAMFMHGTGLNSYWEKSVRSRVRLAATPEGQVRVLTAQTEFGQGTLTALGQIAARELGLADSDILIDHPDTSVVPDSGPTVASRTASIVGSLIREAASLLRQHVAERAGFAAICDPHTIKAAIARCVSVGDSMVFEAEYSQGDGTDDGNRWAPPDAYPAYALGCCVAEVKVDTLTGEIDVVDVFMVCDVGTVVCHRLATNQVIGGAVQGIGWALTEKLAWNDSGGMLNANLSDYAIPSAADVPNIHVHFIDDQESLHYRHPKGLGELPMEGPGPAIANAVAMATGRRPERLPIGPEWILCGQSPNES